MRSWTATRHRGQGSRKDTRCALAFSVSASGGSRRREIVRDARRSWVDWMDRRYRLLPHPANGKRRRLFVVPSVRGRCSTVANGGTYAAGALHWAVDACPSAVDS
ncbi:hypothetical protein EGY16_31210 [Burkholderia pseudomallei]|nr:hypothetical protein CXQ84_24240 [Burkholderia pseudomallei]AYX32342.1 hypothetical protein EGY16_31210 [Burkholderia pseudomallei]EEC31509.1 conserved hypothetical protein [Burkholderia pseudomallei 576]EXI97848.1 hypothetical protein T210_0135340 [Burkholderia pseudomallei MSHR6137]KAA8766034.1 hypothetical protein F5D26_20855 [Burkholderia pseudomallei]